MGAPRSSRAALCLAAIGLAFAGCGGDDGPVRYEEPGEPITAEVGESFEIVLGSNPSTGYEWQLDGRPDPRIVRPEGSSYEPDPGSEDREGGGGEEALGFRAVGEGETTIRLEYVFTGGEERDPVERVASEVTVSAAGE